MSTFSFTVPASAPAVIQSTAITRRERLYGRDVSYEVRSTATPNMEVTPAGDWATVAGRECLRQSLLRELITDPGEWTTYPDYGVGAVSFVKAKDTKGNRDEIERRIRTRFTANHRVKSVESVSLTRGDNSLRISVKVIPIGEIDSSRPLVVTQEVF